METGQYCPLKSTRTKWEQHKLPLLSALLFCTVWYVSVTSKVITSYDSMWVVYAAHSLVHEGDYDLSEFRSQIRKQKHFGVRKINGELYSFFPPGSVFLTVPFVLWFEAAPEWWIRYLPGFPATRAMNEAEPEREISAITAHLELERFVASFYTALSAMILFFILTSQCGTLIALLFTIAFAFGSSAWSIASRGLWQHGPTMALLSLVLLLLSKKNPSKGRVAAAALPLAFSFLVRPTNCISIVALTVMVYIKRRQALLPFLLVGLSVALFFVWFNVETFGTLIPRYYRAKRLQDDHDILNAILVNIVSPSRGLLLFSPWVVFAFGTLVLRRTSKDSIPSGALWFIIFTHLLVVSFFPEWWGGHTFGPRFMSDMLPYLTLLSASGFSSLTTGRTRDGRLLLLTTALSSILWSIWIHASGARSVAGLGWNVQPINIDLAPNRVWDWNDPQFLRSSFPSTANH